MTDDKPKKKFATTLPKCKIFQLGVSDVERRRNLLDAVLNPLSGDKRFHVVPLGDTKSLMVIDSVERPDATTRVMTFGTSKPAHDPQ